MLEKIIAAGIILLCLIEMSDVFTNNPAWYKKEVFFSDWREQGKLDYSTNAVVSWFYSGSLPKYLRQEEFQEFHRRIANGDTLRIGVDYYAFNMSRIYFNNEFFKTYGKPLSEGKVLRFLLHNGKGQTY